MRLPRSCNAPAASRNIVPARRPTAAVASTPTSVGRRPSSGVLYDLMFGMVPSECRQRGQPLDAARNEAADACRLLGADRHLGRLRHVAIALGLDLVAFLGDQALLLQHRMRKRALGRGVTQDVERGTALGKTRAGNVSLRLTKRLR